MSVFGTSELPPKQKLASRGASASPHDLRLESSDLGTPAPVEPPSEAKSPAARRRDPGLESLLYEVRSASERRRVRAIERLGARASDAIAERVVPRLTEALDDDSIQVRAVAIRALGRFGPASNRAIPKVRELMRWNSLRELAMVTLAQQGKAARRAVPDLLHYALDDAERPQVRRRAVEALVWIDPEHEDVRAMIETLKASSNSRLAFLARAVSVES